MCCLGVLYAGGDVVFTTNGDLCFIDKGLLLDERVSILLYKQQLHMV